MDRDDEARPGKRKTPPRSKPRSEAKAGRSRAKPAKVDPARAGAAARQVEELDAQGGDVAKSASRSRASSSAARRAAPEIEPTARDFLEPSHDEVARRAYRRYRETGNEDAFDNWIEAERQLREEQLRREE